MGPAGPRTGRGAGLFILGGNQYFVVCYNTFIGNYGRGAGIETEGGKRAGSGPPCFGSPAFHSSAALRVTPVPIPSGLRLSPDPFWLSAISLSPLSRYARHFPTPFVPSGHFPIPSVSLRSTSPLDKGSRPPDRGNRPLDKGSRPPGEGLERCSRKALDEGHGAHGGTPKKNVFET